MTFQTDRIQLLIAEIDDVLGKTQKSRLGWLNFGNRAQQRQVLEKVRHNLQSLQQQLASTTTQTSMGEQLELLQALPLKLEDSLLSDRSQKTPEQILQALVQEMGYLRNFYERATYTHLRQQYQTDLEILHQQRQTLIEEIEQLEKRRKIYTQLPDQATPQKALKAETTREENNNLLSKAPPSPAKTEVEPEQEPVLSSQRQDPIAFSETLPYAGTEIRPEQIELDRPSTLKAEGNQADPLDYLEPDVWGMADNSQATPTADASEDAPQVTMARDRIGESFTSQPTISDTISALTDLIGSPSLEAKTDYLENTSPIANPNLNETASDLTPTVNANPSTTAESYLPASPDEDLLPSLESTTKSNVDLWLGKNMLDQLSEDLSSLEGMGGSEVQESADTIGFIPNQDYTSFPAQATQPEPEPIATDRDLNSDRQARHSAEETETVDSSATGLPLQPEDVPLNIPEEILAEFDDLFGESFDKIDGIGVSKDRSNLPINADRYQKPEKKN